LLKFDHDQNLPFRPSDPGVDVTKNLGVLNLDFDCLFEFTKMLGE